MRPLFAAAREANSAPPGDREAVASPWCPWDKCLVGSGEDTSVRIDRWLLAARVFKTRTLSQQACSGGRVTVNETRATPHRAVRIGDRVRIQTPRGLRDLEVLALAERRLPAPEASALYEDRSPPPAPRPTAEPVVLERERGEGRPSKRDRRSMDRFRGRR